VCHGSTSRDVFYCWNSCSSVVKADVIHMQPPNLDMLFDIPSKFTGQNIKTGGDCRQGEKLRRSVNFNEKMPFLAQIAQLLYRF